MTQWFWFQWPRRYDKDIHKQSWVHFEDDLVGVQSQSGRIFATFHNRRRNMDEPQTYKRYQTIINWGPSSWQNSDFFPNESTPKETRVCLSANKDNYLGWMRFNRHRFSSKEKDNEWEYYAYGISSTMLWMINNRNWPKRWGSSTKKIQGCTP